MVLEEFESVYKPTRGCNHACPAKFLVCVERLIRDVELTHEQNEGTAGWFCTGLGARGGVLLSSMGMGCAAGYFQAQGSWL